jgi:hypothetical protein
MEDCSDYKERAREYAENYLSIDKVMKRFTEEIGLSKEERSKQLTQKPVKTV